MFCNQRQMAEPQEQSEPFASPSTEAKRPRQIDLRRKRCGRVPLSSRSRRKRCEPIPLRCICEIYPFRACHVFLQRNLFVMSVISTVLPEQTCPECAREALLQRGFFGEVPARAAACPARQRPAPQKVGRHYFLAPCLYRLHNLVDEYPSCARAIGIDLLSFLATA